jgi:hypothetical protein
MRPGVPVNENCLRKIGVKLREQRSDAPIRLQEFVRCA